MNRSRKRRLAGKAKTFAVCGAMTVLAASVGAVGHHAHDARLAYAMTAVQTAPDAFDEPEEKIGACEALEIQAEEKAPDAIWVMTDIVQAPDLGIPMAEQVPGMEREEARAYTEEDLEVMTRVLTGECQTGSWELQTAVGSVVLNRVMAGDYPDSVKRVVFQKGQYACTWDGNYYRKPTARNREVADYLLRNGSQIPADVIYQGSQKRKGLKLWKVIEGEYFYYREGVR